MFRHCREYISANDIASEAFKISYEKLSDFKGQSKYSTWVCKIANTLLTKEYKKLLHAEKLENDIILKSPAYSLPENIIIEKECKHCVRQAFGTLPPLLKFLLMQNVLKNMNEPAIAEKTGLSERYVKFELSIAKRILKHRFIFIYTGKLV